MTVPLIDEEPANTDFSATDTEPRIEESAITERLEPRIPWPREERPEPSATLSNTDRPELNAPKPKTETDEPRRAKRLKDAQDPIVDWPETLNEDDPEMEPRIEIDEPK